jgi:hypothetical protein
VKIRLLTAIKSVAVVAIFLGAVVHVLRLFREEDDLASSFLIVEGIGIALLVGIALGVRYFVNLVRDDDRYTRELRRSDGASSFQWSGDLEKNGTAEKNGT